MQIKITNFNAKENELNEVTSKKVFKPRRARDKHGNWRFHDEGIFSRKIFGKLYKCSCGKNTEVGTWCDVCGDRVVSKDKMPDFYISCGINAPFAHNDYSVFGKNGKEIKMLMEYEAFLYDGEVVEFDLSNLDMTQYQDQDLMSIGSEAAMLYDSNVTEEWVKNHTSINVPVPHPIYRPIIKTPTNGYILGNINNILVDLLDKKSNILSFRDQEGEIDKFQELTLSKLLYDKYKEVIDSVLEVLIQGKKSVMKQEVEAQPVSGAFRAIITNNDSLDEDTIKIGYELISTIYPDLAKKYKDNYEELNRVLKTEKYKVLVNRPPTIGEKSIIAMYPEINLDEDAKFVISTNSIVFDGMAADTDGDAFLIISIFSYEANKEAETMLPSVNNIGGSNGKVRNKMPDDFIYTMSQIYKKNPEAKNKIKQIIKDNMFDRV